MKAWRLPTALAVCAGFILPALLAAIPQDVVKTKLAGDSQLQSVLVQARDAVVAETHLQGYDTRIETDVKRVTRYLLQTGSRNDVLYLQDHLEHEYAEKIRGVLRPADTLADFTARARAAEVETDLYSHDEDIELIVEQELERGFLEDALQEAKLMRVRLSQIRTMGAIALVAHNRGDLEKTESAVAAAVARAKSTEPAADLVFDHHRMLLELASAWHEGGYGSAALTARQQAIKLLQTDPSGYQGYWRDLGEAAAQQGDLKMAAQTLEHLSDPGEPLYVQTEMQRAQAKMAGPARALEIAGGMHAGDLKFEALREIAVRQIDSGDKVGAARILQVAMEAANADDDFRVMRMADIAWEQIVMGDKSAADVTIAEGLRANEKHRWGSDQVSGWMMLAEDLAYMGEYDRALQVARKNEDAGTRARALQLVAYRETQAGHGDWAISWAQGVEDPEGRARIFVGIAAGLIEQITGKDQDINKY